MTLLHSQTLLANCTCKFDAPGKSVFFCNKTRSPVLLRVLLAVEWRGQFVLMSYVTEEAGVHNTTRQKYPSDLLTS